MFLLYSLGFDFFSTLAKTHSSLRRQDNIRRLDHMRIFSERHLVIIRSTSVLFLCLSEVAVELDEGLFFLLDVEVRVVELVTPSKISFHFVLS